MPKFQNLPRTIDAELFSDPDNPPRGVKLDGYKGGTDPSDRVWSVISIQGTRVEVRPGEWIVDEGDGVHFYPIKDDGGKPKGYQEAFFATVDLCSKLSPSQQCSRPYGHSGDCVVSTEKPKSVLDGIPVVTKEDGMKVERK